MKNGFAKSLIMVSILVGCLVLGLVFNLYRDAKRKNEAREQAVSDLIKVVKAADSINQVRYDSLAARIHEHHQKQSPPPYFPKLDTAYLRQQIDAPTDSAIYLQNQIWIQTPGKKK